MTTIDHIILKVNDLEQRADVYTSIMGFQNEGSGEVAGARGSGPRLYFDDPDKHFIEIRTYE